MALGTTVQVTFYDADPAEAGNVLNMLTFTYGEDSEAAFAQSFAEARQDAAYVTVEVGEQTRTVDLSAVIIPTDGRGLLPRELAYGRGLQDGGTVTATFYNADPETAGQITDTLSFTYGEDSEAAFADDFATAAEEAAFVTVTTSPQAYTVDLSQQGFDSRGFDRSRRGHR